jgi:hypothetical protein
VAEANARKWSSIGQIGEGFANKATSLLAQQWQDERDIADETAVLDASTKLKAHAQDLTQQAQEKTGLDAMASQAPITEDFGKFAGTLEAGLKTDRQRLAFARVKANEALGLDINLKRHSYQEQQNYSKDVLKATVETSVNAAIFNALDPPRAGREIQNAVGAIQMLGPKLGLLPDQITAMSSAATSDAHVGIVNRLLAVDKAQAAKAYFEEAKSQINGDALAGVEKALELGTTRGESQKQADTILLAGGTPAEQRAKVREITDPALRDAVQERVEHNIAVTEKQARDGEEDATRQAYAIIDKTGSFSAIPTDLLSRLPGDARPGLRNYARARAKGEPVETDLSIYYGLLQQAGDNPTDFVKVNLLAKRSQLDDSDFKQLAHLQLSIRNDDRAATEKVLSAVMTRSQIFTEGISDAFIVPDTPEANALHRELDRRVEQWQTDTGKPASNEQVQAVMDTLVQQVVLTPATPATGGLWGFGMTPGQAAKIKRGMDLTVDDIPAADRARVEASLRAAQQPVTPDSIVNWYLRAKRKMGGVK